MNAAKAAPLASALYVGTVRHRRLAPRPHAFTYPVYQLLLDLDELPRVEEEVGLFRHNAHGWSAVFDDDYMGPSRRPIRARLTAGSRSISTSRCGSSAIASFRRSNSCGSNPAAPW